MISDEAVEAAAKAVYGGDHLDGSPQRDAWLRDFRIALEAAAPIILADAVSRTEANNDHIEAGSGAYSSGFHYALQCIHTED